MKIRKKNIINWSMHQIEKEKKEKKNIYVSVVHLKWKEKKHMQGNNLR